MSCEAINELIINHLDSTTAMTRMKQHLICFSDEMVKWYIDYFKKNGYYSVFINWFTNVNRYNYFLSLDSKCSGAFEDIELLFKEFNLSFYIKSKSDSTLPDVKRIECFDDINDSYVDCRFNRYCIPASFLINEGDPFSAFKEFLSFMTFGEDTIYLVDPYIFKTDAFRVLYHPLFKKCPNIIIYYSREYEPNDLTQATIKSINNSNTGRHIQYKPKRKQDIHDRHLCGKDWDITCEHGFADIFDCSSKIANYETKVNLSPSFTQPTICNFGTS